MNRYPIVFAAVQQLARAARLAAPRILSFGSSSGEEAETLSTLYFPQSAILGLDVSDESLAAARAAFGANPHLRFEKSGVHQPEPDSFDIIFAMSVLCRWPITREMDDIAALFPFASFERQATYLDGLLKPGGFLVIYNASYSFLHASASAHYDLIVHPRIRTAGFVKRFRKDGRHDPDVAMTDCIYRKQPPDERTGRRGLVIRDGTLRQLGVIERDIAI